MAITITVGATGHPTCHMAIIDTESYAVENINLGNGGLF